MAPTCGRLCRIRETCLQGFWMPLLIGICFIIIGILLQLSQQSQPQMSRAAKFGVIFCMFGSCCTMAALGWCVFDCSKKNRERRTAGTGRAYFPFWIAGNNAVSGQTIGGQVGLNTTGLTPAERNANSLHQLFNRRRSSPPPSYLQAIAAQKPSLTNFHVNSAGTTNVTTGNKQVCNELSPSITWQQLQVSSLQQATISDLATDRENLQLPNYQQALQLDSGDFVSIDLSTDHLSIAYESVYSENEEDQPAVIGTNKPTTNLPPVQHQKENEDPPGCFTNPAFRRTF